MAERQQIDAAYRRRLKDLPGIHLPSLPASEVRNNYAYFPVEIDQQAFGRSRDELYEALKKYNIFTRRYFHPLVTEYACYRSLSLKDPLSRAREVAGRILTLPIHHALSQPDVEKICDCLASLVQTPRARRRVKGAVQMSGAQKPSNVLLSGAIV